MTTAASYTRSGYATLTAYLAVEDAAAAHRFYCDVFGATVAALLQDANGRIVHGALRIGDSTIVVNDEMPQVGLVAPARGGTCSTLLYCADADAVFARAVAAGARPIAPVTQNFSGERHGLLVCPFGHRWIIATQVEEVPDAEVRRRWIALSRPEPTVPATI